MRVKAGLNKGLEHLASLPQDPRICGKLLTRLVQPAKEELELSLAQVVVVAGHEVGQGKPGGGGGGGGGPLGHREVGRHPRQLVIRAEDATIILGKETMTFCSLRWQPWHI